MTEGGIMQIVPTRTMRLDGQDVFEGVLVDVSDADAALALGHGWAVAAPAKPAEPAQPKRRQSKTGAAAGGQ